MACAVSSTALIACNDGGAQGANISKAQSTTQGVNYQDSGLYYVMTKTQAQDLVGKSTTKDLIFMWRVAGQKNWEVAGKDGKAIDIIVDDTTQRTTLVGPEVGLEGLDGEVVEVRVFNSATKKDFIYKMKLFGDSTDTDDATIPVGEKLTSDYQWAVFNPTADRKPRIMMINPFESNPILVGYNTKTKQVVVNDLQGDKSLKVYSLTVTNNGIDAQFTPNQASSVNVSLKGTNLSSGLGISPLLDVYSYSSPTKGSDLLFANNGQQLLVFKDSTNTQLSVVSVDPNNSGKIRADVNADIRPADPENDSQYASYEVPVDSTASLIPHRTYNIKYTCSLNGYKPCELNKDDLSASISTQNKLPINDISKVLRDALLIKGLVDTDGDVKLIGKPTIESGNTVVVPYTPYYAESLGAVITIKHGSEVLSFQTPKVGEYYNFRFETGLVSGVRLTSELASKHGKSTDADFFGDILLDDNNSVGVVTGLAAGPNGGAFDSHNELRDWDYGLTLRNTIDYVNAHLQIEGRYGMNLFYANYTGASTIVSIPDDITFKFPHSTNLPIKIGFARTAEDAILQEPRIQNVSDCYGYIVQNRVDHQKNSTFTSVTMTRDGSVGDDSSYSTECYALKAITKGGYFVDDTISNKQYDVYAVSDWSSDVVSNYGDFAKRRAAVRTYFKIK